MADRKNQIRRVSHPTINPKVFEDLAELLAGKSDPLPKGAFTVRQAIGTKLGGSISQVGHRVKLLVRAGKLKRQSFRVWDGKKYQRVPYYFRP